MAKPTGDLFRLLVKDLITYDEGWAGLHVKWKDTPGIYDAVEKNFNNFSVFGIRAWRGKPIKEKGKTLHRIGLLPQNSPVCLLVWSDNKMGIKDPPGK